MKHYDKEDKSGKEVKPATSSKWTTSTSKSTSSSSSSSSEAEIDTLYLNEIYEEEEGWEGEGGVVGGKIAAVEEGKRKGKNEGKKVLRG